MSAFASLRFTSIIDGDRLSVLGNERRLHIQLMQLSDPIASLPVCHVMTQHDARRTTHDSDTGMTDALVKIGEDW
jgi:hypothetical protein